MKQDTLSLVSSFKGHANMMRMQHQIEEKSTKKLFQEDHKVILTREEERLKCEANKKLFEEDRLKREAQLAADREKIQLAEELERLKMQEERDVANQELLKRKDAQGSQMAKDRYNINDLKLQKLPLAQSIQVKLLDLSMLMDEKIVTVCENTPENLAMHNQIQAEINKYCAEEKRLTGYKPM